MVTFQVQQCRTAAAHSVRLDLTESEDDQCEYIVCNYILRAAKCSSASFSIFTLKTSIQQSNIPYQNPAGMEAELREFYKRKYIRNYKFNVLIFSLIIFHPDCHTRRYCRQSCRFHIEGDPVDICTVAVQPVDALANRHSR